MTTNYFTDFLEKTDHRMVSKWMHYFDAYAAELGHLQGKDITFLEIGVWKGGSIPMWGGYFGKGSTLVFADINPACRELADPGTFVEIGDQSDPVFLKMLADKYGPFDVIIDDGGHKMDQQTISFENLWPAIKDGGHYLVEDTHTSYWPGFGGGYQEQASFIEYAKRLVDQMHSWYTDQDEIFPLSQMARELTYVHFYDSIVAMKRDLKKAPPVTVTSTNGQIGHSRRALEVRGRKSIF